MKVIVSHVNQDFDSLASMIAALKLYPDAIPLDPGAIEKNVRIFLKDYPDLINYTKIKNINIDEIDTIILLDTRQPNRTVLPKEVFERSKIIIFDHHPHHKNDVDGDKETIRYYGATITILLKELKRKHIHFTHQEANLFAMGIFEDTGMLTYSSVTTWDIKALDFLLKNDAEFSLSRKYISYDLDQKQLKIFNQLINKADVYNFSGINIIIGDAETEIYVDGVSLLAHKLMDPGNYKVGFIIIQMKNRVHLIARSRVPEINVSKILEKFGGGGHPSAASAVIKNMSKFQVKEKLITDLKKISNSIFNAKEIMEKNLIFIGSNQTIEQASALFKKTDKGYIIVLKSGDVIGYLGRNDIKRATRHKLSKKSLLDIIANDFELVSPNIKISTIYKKIFAANKLLLVHKNNKVLGIISKKTIKPFTPNEFKDDPINVLTHKFHYSITSNANKLLIKYLPSNLYEILREISSIAQQEGYSAYLVGGFVRDLLIASFKKHHDKMLRFDFDIVTPQNGIKFARLLGKHLNAKVTSHRKFNTAILIFKKGQILPSQEFRIDIATARKEKYYYPGALPVVKNAPLRKDLFRRDFTINTIAIALVNKEFGKVIDFFRGQNDMKKGLIRVLHNLSFIDDPTRIFRAIRFAGRLNFKLEEHTERLLKNAIKSRYIKNLSGKRIFEELKYIFNERNPIPMANNLSKYHAYYFISPELKFNEEKEELILSIFEVLSWYKLLFAETTINKWTPYFIALIHDISQKEKIKVCKNFFVTKKNTQIILKIEKIFSTIRNKLLRSNKIIPSKIYEILCNTPIEILLFIMARAKKDKLIEKKISFYLIELYYEKIFITGKELLGFGFKPGPMIGEIKRKLLYLKLDGKIKTKKAEINYIKRYILPKLSKNK